MILISINQLVKFDKFIFASEERFPKKIIQG